jgi:outer membrane murein-binding lipoprotein Lpp
MDSGTAKDFIEDLQLEIQELRAKIRRLEQQIEQMKVAKPAKSSE